MVQLHVVGTLHSKGFAYLKRKQNSKQTKQRPARAERRTRNDPSIVTAAIKSSTVLVYPSQGSPHGRRGISRRPRVTRQSRTTETWSNSPQNSRWSSGGAVCLRNVSPYKTPLSGIQLEERGAKPGWACTHRRCPWWIDEWGWKALWAVVNWVWGGSSTVGSSLLKYHVKKYSLD